MTTWTAETFKPITINWDLVTSGDEIENEIYLLNRSNQLRAHKILTEEIPEDHIVHNVPGNISASVKFLFFTWEKNNSGWIAKNLLSGDKNIRFYGSEVKINGTTVKQWVSLEKSAMPPVNAMPGNTFDEKRKNLELLLKTFDPPEEKKEN